MWILSDKACSLSSFIHIFSKFFLHKISSTNNKNVEPSLNIWYSSLHLFLYILDTYSSLHEILHIFRIKNGIRNSNWGVHFDSYTVKSLWKLLYKIFIGFKFQMLKIVANIFLLDFHLDYFMNGIAYLEEYFCRIFLFQFEIFKLMF